MSRDSTHEGTDHPVLLRLFVVGDSAASVRARRQLEALLEKLGPDSVEVTVIDVRERPQLAEEERVLATPVLIRVAPPPRCSVIGDLGDERMVASVLGLSEPGQP